MGVLWVQGERVGSWEPLLPVGPSQQAEGGAGASCHLGAGGLGVRVGNCSVKDSRICWPLSKSSSCHPHPRPSRRQRNLDSHSETQAAIVSRRKNRDKECDLYFAICMEIQYRYINIHKLGLMNFQLHSFNSNIEINLDSQNAINKPKCWRSFEWHNTCRFMTSAIPHSNASIFNWKFHILT